jgi:hypothetical protein
MLAALVMSTNLILSSGDIVGLSRSLLIKITFTVSLLATRLLVMQPVDLILVARYL